MWVDRLWWKCNYIKHQMWRKITSLLFKNASTRQTVAKNTFWLSVGNVGGRLLRAVIVIYAARVLGASSWGVFSYAISLIAVLAIFIDMGINSIMTREVAKRIGVEEHQQVLSTSFIMKLILLALGIFVVLVVGPHLTNNIEVKAILPIAVFIMAFDSVREFGSSLIRAFEKMELEAGIFLLTNVAIVTFGFVFLGMAGNVKSFTYAYAAGSGVGAMATLIILRNKLAGLFSNFSKKIVRLVLIAAWPFAVAGVLGLLLTNMDILIIGWLRSAEDVGLYSASLRIVQFMYILPALLATSVLPALSRFAGNDNNKFRIMLEKALSVLFAVAIPLALGAVILGPKIISFVFGSSYLPATLAFQILMFTMIVDFPATLLASAAFAYNHQKVLIIYSGIAGTLNVVLDLLLIPKFGIAGSSLATLIAQIISNVYLWRTMEKINHFTALKNLKKIVLASALMSLLVWGLSAIGVHVVLAVAAAILFYFAALAALKEPIIEEVRTILQGDASGERPSSVSGAQ